MAPSTEQRGPVPDACESARADADHEPEPVRLSPQEARALLDESTAIKAEANASYSRGDYDSALSRYEDALSTCPDHLHYERSVLQSNMAACHLQLERWKDAIKAATGALDGLAASEGGDESETRPAGSREDTGDEDEQERPREEVIRAPGPTTRPDDGAAEGRKADVGRIRIKALLRRARARVEAGGWQNLAGAEDDYKLLLSMTGLGVADLRTVRGQLAALPPRVAAAREEEMSEMWGKLKTLGDGILKPFGLSTSNFQMVKDETSGGYSMNFTQGGGSSREE